MNVLDERKFARELRVYSIKGKIADYHINPFFIDPWRTGIRGQPWEYHSWTPPTQFRKNVCIIFIASGISGSLHEKEPLQSCTVSLSTSYSIFFPVGLIFLFCFLRKDRKVDMIGIRSSAVLRRSAAAEPQSMGQWQEAIYRAALKLP